MDDLLDVEDELSMIGHYLEAAAMAAEAVQPREHRSAMTALLGTIRQRLKGALAALETIRTAEKVDA